MRQSVIAGVVLGVIVAIWTQIMGITGMYKNPSLAWLFWLVIAINIGVVIWGLGKTRAQNGYGGQVAAAVVIGIVGAVLIMLNSYLLTTAVVPEYLDEIKAVQEEMILQAGSPQEVVDVQLATLDKVMTPGVQAVMGGIGTLLTSLITGLIAAIWIRKKG